jgi:hypothetical protein
MSIELITDKTIWDSFVDSSPDGMIFHKWDLLKIVEKYTGDTLYPYGIYQSNDLLGVIPIFYSKRRGMKFVYSPPKTTLSYIPYMGFALSESYYRLKQKEKETFRYSIIKETDDLLKGMSPNYISFTTVPGDVDVRPYARVGYDTLLQYTYFLDLNRPLDAIWDEFDRNCRKRITTAEKLDLSLVRADDAEALFKMMKGRLSKNGNTFFHRQSPNYLKELLTAFPDNIKMYFLYSGNDLIGADVNYEYKNCCTSWMGTAIVNEDLNANEYMLWVILKTAKEAGMKRYENVGADERRLNDFKTKFNPSLVPFFYVIKKNMLYRTASTIVDRLTKMTGGAENEN